MAQRYSYIDTEMIEKMSWIDFETVSCANSLSFGRSHSDFNMLSILKLLHPLSAGPIKFTRIQYLSGIRMKERFLKYLKFSIQMNFVRKLPRQGQEQHYMLTDKGHQLLDMFYIA